MPRKHTADAVSRITLCNDCRQPIRPSDCYRRLRISGGREHVACMSIALTNAMDRLAKRPLRSREELLDAFADRADEICAEVCEHPKH